MEDIKKYNALIKKATLEEIEQLTVIFCTTSVASNPKLLSGISGHVFQLIIDEAAMCTEPESIVPIIATKAKQVVLIGDHKQLRPVVSCTAAENSGLSISLFERYAERRKGNVKLTLLQLQYRMVSSQLKANAHQFKIHRRICSMLSLVVNLL